MRYALADAIADVARNLAIVAFALALGAAVYRVGLDGGYGEGWAAAALSLEGMAVADEDDGSEPA